MAIMYFKVKPIHLQSNTKAMEETQRIESNNYKASSALRSHSLASQLYLLQGFCHKRPQHTAQLSMPAWVLHSKKQKSW